MSTDVEHVTCREFVEVLTDYLENALDPAERAEIERHIVICRGCANYVEQMRSTIELLARSAATGDGGEVHSEPLLALFREWKAGRA
jgi:anti-sigma factor RsiW